MGKKKNKPASYSPFTYVAAGFGAAVGLRVMYWLATEAFRKNPATRAGHAFSRALIDRGVDLKITSMRTLDDGKPQAYFGSWVATVQEPTPEIRKLASDAADANGVKLLTYNSPDSPTGETFVFVGGV